MIWFVLIWFEVTENDLCWNGLHLVYSEVFTLLCCLLWIYSKTILQMQISTQSALKFTIANWTFQILIRIPKKFLNGWRNAGIILADSSYQTVVLAIVCMYSYAAVSFNVLVQILILITSNNSDAHRICQQSVFERNVTIRMLMKVQVLVVIQYVMYHYKMDLFI